MNTEPMSGRERDSRVSSMVFLILNVLIGVLFLKRALELVSDLRRARRIGEPAPTRLIRDPTEL